MCVGKFSFKQTHGAQIFDIQSCISYSPISWISRWYFLWYRLITKILHSSTKATVFTLLGNILYTWYYCGEASWFPVFYIRYSVHEWLIKLISKSTLFHPFTYISSPVDMYLDNFCWQQNSLVRVCLNIIGWKDYAPWCYFCKTVNSFLLCYSQKYVLGVQKERKLPLQWSFVLLTK